ncbi:hypothetical protein PHMEG_00035497, partial [Phytophthora megakarya]
EPVARSVDSATDGSPVGDDPVSAAAALGASSPTSIESSDVNQECNNPPTETQSEEKSSDAAVADLEHTFMRVMHVLSTEGNDDPADDDYAVHEANYISLEDYAQELAFLPDLTEPSVTELDYTAPNVKNPSFRNDQQRRLDEKLYELLKGLLKAGLIAFSDSLWASPIVIVLKKNGQDIRVCIDYKMANAVTAIMEYAIPLIDDLLTELENYLWFCSLDAASGVSAIMMTMRERKISAFVCVLRMVNDPYADMFATNKPDESSLVPVFQRRSFVDDIFLMVLHLTNAGQVAGAV